MRNGMIVVSVGICMVLAAGAAQATVVSGQVTTTTGQGLPSLGSCRRASTARGPTSMRTRTGSLTAAQA